MLSLIGFFTRLPVKRTSIESAARHSYLLPLVGLFIGALVGGFYLILDNFLGIYLNKYILALLTVLSLYFITGLNHLDGLADFFDGIYTCKSREKKINALKDTKIGISGLTSILFLLLFLIFSLASLENIFFKILLAELSAKTCMLIAMSVGKSRKQGFGYIFIKHLNKRLLPLSILFSLLVSYLLLGLAGIYTIITSIIIMFYLVHIAHKNFGFINGDVFGAINEITRAVCLFVLLFF